MQRKLKNYQKRKWKRKMNKRLAAPVLHASMREFLGQLAKHGMMGRMHDSALCLLSSWAKPCFLGQTLLPGPKLLLHGKNGNFPREFSRTNTGSANSVGKSL